MAVQESCRRFSVCVDMGWCVRMWEVNKHEVNLCSSIFFGGGRKVKERKESKGEEEGNENRTLAF